MPYVTSVERIGIQKGSVRTAQEAVIDVLDLRFHDVPESTVEAVNAIEDTSFLRTLHRMAVTASSLEEWERALGEYS